jgi:hypothetical protein
MVVLCVVWLPVELAVILPCIACFRSLDGLILDNDRVIFCVSGPQINYMQR